MNPKQMQEMLNRKAQFLDAKERALNRKELSLQQGQVPNTGPQTLQRNLGAALDPQMRPGNVGELNKCIWPFYFTTESFIIDPNQTVKSGFSVTQEAGFIWMAYTKSVYLVTGGTDYTYVDPDDSSAAGEAPGLSFTVRDSSSGREYDNIPIDLDGVGNPRWPTCFPRPLFFLPNSNIEISYNNSDPVNSYAPFITAFGYRVRIEDAQNLLGVVFV